MRRYLLVVALLLAVTALQPPWARATFPGENGVIAVQSWDSIFFQPPDRLFGSTVFCDKCDRPAFSPEGARLAYQEFLAGGGSFVGPAGIRVSDLVTGAVTVVSTGNEAPYSWTSDGEKVFLVGPGIQTLNADGSGGLTQILPYGTAPVMSPDGSKIAFNCNSYPYSDASPCGICLMDADGSNVTALSRAGPTAQNPDWSPNGNKIVFTADLNGGDRSIYVMNRNGRGIKRLLPFPNISSPIWSPDSKRIAFVAYPTGEQEPCHNVQTSCYFVVDSNGANLTLIFGAEVFIGRESWQPLPAKGH